VTIRKGRDWATPVPVPDDAVTVTGDAELAALVAEARSAGRPCPSVVLAGGDLSRTLGGGAGRRRPAGQAVRVVVDLGWARLDGGPERPFAAHAVARRPAWSGPFAVAMNAAWLGSWYLGPRAHPNDGLLDITEGALAPTQRLLARRRLATGTHLPHPALRATRVAEASLAWPRALTVRLDGIRVGRARRLGLRCEPDAVACWV
jgi:hypothetical protein